MEQKIDERLQQAADEYAKQHINSLDYISAEHFDVFVAGAKWMASQGITVEGDTDTGLSDESYLKLQDYFKSLPKETKVILQIRKE